MIMILACIAMSAIAVHASIPAQNTHASPIPAPVIGANGAAALPAVNPAMAAKERKSVADAPKDAEEKYLPGVDFMGKMAGVPINPAAHLQRVLAEDKKYVASILRAPVDLGDPTDCKHSDIVKDEKELRKIALRILHRRVSLKQQQHWIDRATDGLRKIESEISTTTDTARNLAEQLDALTAQKNDITNHVRRAILLKELDNTSSNLMRLKNARMKEEVSLQQKHNKFAIRNHEHNQVLKRLHKMRTKHGLKLGYLEDPKPYRFAQQGIESAVEESNQQEVETEGETEAETEVEADQEQEVEQEADVDATAETQSEAQTETETDAAAETETEGEAEAEVEQSTEQEQQ
jgi:hypothetical protein